MKSICCGITKEACRDLSLYLNCWGLHYMKKIISKMYKLIMGFKYRPLFKSDLRELLANVMQVKKYVASLDHHDTYKEQLELIENNLSSYSFKSLKYLASERKKLLSIEREL